MSITRATTPIRTASLAAVALGAVLLAGCGSDAADDGAPASGTGTATAPTSAAPVAGSGGGSGGGVDGPCDVTDRATVASVFPGAGPGKEGEVRNCEYTLASGAVQTVNVYYYEDTTLKQFSKQDTDNGITFTTVPVGDGAIRDQLHTLTVQQGDVLFSVQALPRSGRQSDYAAADPQTLALATRIAAKL